MADVIIVGAGLAGLNCALKLQARGVTCTILEATDAVGGRVRTDLVDGFLLDRGFQVLLTAYPEARRALDYNALDLKKYEPGAVVMHRQRGRLVRSHVADPLRVPARAFQSLFASLGTLFDKRRVARLGLRLKSTAIDELLNAPETTTEARLRELGFSGNMVERFLRPFLGGIYLERELLTSSRKFEFVLKMFAEGDAALPARGMQAIPEQMAARLSADSLRLGERVASVKADGVRLESGEELSAKAVVVATDDPATLLPSRAGRQPRQWAGTTCMYFSANEPPIPYPTLVLNGSGRGLINNMSVVTNVAPSYAPKGMSLISVSVVPMWKVSDEEIESTLRAELRAWFGAQVTDWKVLRRYDIRYGLPLQSPANGGVNTQQEAQTEAGIFIAGDHLDTASQNGALRSGRRAAEMVLEHIGASKLRA